MLKKVFSQLDKNFEKYIMAVLLAVLVFLVSYDVIMRYVFNNGQAFVQEASRYTMLFIIFFGISYGVKYSAHLRMDMIMQVFPKTKPLLNIIGDAAMIVFGLLLIVFGWTKVQELVVSGQASAILKFPKWVLYFGMWFGWLLAMLRFFQKYFLKIYRFAHGIKEEEVDDTGII
ncbi:MAG: TRAP transporter small permease [Clostridiales Family XIII bacterium]|jgi:C4-dicarboxylate transporter DctQ subunit|nr:TRAP transporter small permease [Clostridiales Family XIII bacterium]